ncbi:hypothetical protein EVA_09623, partial [gut metagenome]
MSSLIRKAALEAKENNPLDLMKDFKMDL